jgi:hypothetical protein
MKIFDFYLKSIFILLFFQKIKQCFFLWQQKKVLTTSTKVFLGQNDPKLSHFEKKMSKFAIGLDYRFYQVNKLKQESLKISTLPCIM